MQLQNQFKIRCSAIGKIMTEPRSKSEILSKTCISYVHEWLKEQPEFYNRRIEFKSKYCEKGNVMENESIDFASKYYGWGIVEKNTIELSNEYLTGTCDVILSKTVEDIKNSWSQKSFPLFDNEIPIDGYGWQLQGYCELYKKEQGGLVYTLMDAPEYIINREARSKAWDLGMDEVEAELYDEVEASMIYSNLPDELRIKRYFVDKNQELIEKCYDKVELIRKYIISL